MSNPPPGTTWTAPGQGARVEKVKGEDMKQCYMCGQEKPYGCFHRKHANRDGRDARCKVCTKAYQQRPRVKAAMQINSRRYDASPHGRKKNQERGAAYKQSANGKATAKRGEARARAKNPERSRATKAVYQALSRGGMSKPAGCTLCDSPRHIQAHHFAYAKPFDLAVFWLCAQCHRVAHSLGAINARILSDRFRVGA